ncbi:MAG: YciI family protein [Ferruginibacter sp.]
MKLNYVVLCSFLLMSSFTFAQDQNTKPKRPEDQIEQYWFVLLKTGPKTDFDSTTKAKLFQGHMANINRLYYYGILKVAGPFGKNGLAWRGIFIFDCKTKEEAEQIVSSDPAVAAGLFAVEIVPWYSSPIGSFMHGKPEKKD